jgi:hypothetical protein
VSSTVRKRVVVGFNLLEILDDLLHIEHVGARLFLPSPRLVSALACFSSIPCPPPPLSVALSSRSFTLVSALACFSSSLFLPLTLHSLNPSFPGLPSLSRFRWFVLIKKI